MYRYYVPMVGQVMYLGTVHVPVHVHVDLKSTPSNPHPLKSTRRVSKHV